MFEVSCQFMEQLITLIPGILGIYLIFDFLGSLFFGKR